MADPKTEEEVFNDDLDPLQAISQLRADGAESPFDNAENEAPTPDEVDEFAQDDPDKKAEDSSDDSSDYTDEKAVDDSSDDDTGDQKDDFDDKNEDQSDAADDTADDSSEETAEVVMRKFKANGQEFEFTEEEMLEQFGTIFGKAMNFTQKTQQLAPYRKMISALEEEGITNEQLNLAIDALKGNKDAFTEMLKMNEIDPYDLDTDKNQDYTPNEYGKTEQQQEFDEVIQSISQDAEYSQTVNVVNKVWDHNSQNVLAQNPGMIAGLHNDIKSGVYDKVAPEAAKMKMLDGNQKSDIEYYMLAGQKLEQQQAASESTQNQDTAEDLNKKTQAAENQYDQASSEASQKRAASNTRTRADRKGVVDYLDDDDEKFDDWYKNLMSKN